MYDMTKQAKWVQEEFDRLERQVVRLTREVDELRSKEVVQYADDLKWHRPIGIERGKSAGYLDGRNIETLPQGTTVYFKQNRKGGYIEARQERYDQNNIRIMTGGGRLVIRPEVSNVIRVEIEP